MRSQHTRSTSLSALLANSYIYILSNQHVMASEDDVDLTVQVQKNPSITEISRGDEPNLILADKLVIADTEFTKTPDVELSISPGVHEILIEKDGYERVNKSINIPEGVDAIEKTYYLNSKEDEEVLLSADNRTKLNEIKQEQDLETIADALEFAIESCVDNESV